MMNTETFTIDEGLFITENLVEKALLTASPYLLHMTGHLSKANGKGIRTQVLLGAAMDSNGAIQYAAAKAAAAVELLHMATLIHDDVIDNAPIRRGIETLHTKFGKKDAVICGDYLLSIAMKMVSDLAYDDYSKYGYLAPSMTNALSKICEGQYREILENKNLDLSMYDYLKIISGKTAALFYISAYSGAVIGGCEEKEAKSISRFGKYLGIMFQILDDCKDFELSREQAKKPVQNDIAEGVVTLPLILAVNKSKKLKQLAALFMANGGGDAGALIKEVVGLGALDDTKNITERYRLKAENCISTIENEAKKSFLIKILNNVVF